jgi:hypothetical protein
MENIVKFNTFDAVDEFDKLRIDLDELYEKERVKEELKTETFQKILKRLFIKIKHVAKASTQYLLYQIPQYLIGNPRYNMIECVEYVTANLENNGFKTKFIHPNILFVTWHHYIPYYQRMQYKAKTGILIDGFGNVISRKSETPTKKENIFENITKMRPDPPKHVHFVPPKDEIEFSMLNQKQYRDTSKIQTSGLF